MIIKIWVKIVSEDRIVRHVVVEFAQTRLPFFDIVKTACERIDVETPVVLNKHFEEFKNFRLTTFDAGDFIDSIKFDRLVIERI